MLNSVLSKWVFTVACMTTVAVGGVVFAHGGHGGGGHSGGGHGGGGHGGGGGHSGGGHSGGGHMGGGGHHMGGGGGHHYGGGGYGGYGGFGGFYGGYGGFGGYYGGYPGYGYGYGLGSGYGYGNYGYGSGAYYAQPIYSTYNQPIYSTYNQPIYSTPAYSQPVYSNSNIYSGSSPVVTSSPQVVYDGGEIVLFSPPSNTQDVQYTLNGAAYTMKPGALQKFSNDRNWTIDVSLGNGQSVKYTLSTGRYKFKQSDAGMGLFTTQDQPGTQSVTPSTIAPAPAPMPQE